MDETEVETVVRLRAVDVRDLFPDFSPEDASSRVCLLCATKLKDKTHNLTRHLERHHVGALLQMMEQRAAASPTATAGASARTSKTSGAAASTSSSRARKQQIQEQPSQPKGHSQKQRRVSSSPHSVAPVKDKGGGSAAASTPSPSPVSELKPDQIENAKLALVTWLAHEQLPMSLVANNGFRQFVHSLNGKFNPPEHDELQQVLERMHARHRQVEKANKKSTDKGADAGNDSSSESKKAHEKKKQRVERKIVVETKALVAVSRTLDDAPLVGYQQLPCGVLQSGFVQVRVHLAMVSHFDALACRGDAKGRQGVLGRAFVGVVEQVNPVRTQSKNSRFKEQQRVALASSLLSCSACTLKAEMSSSSSSCCTHLQHFGVSSSRGALSEYIELPEANLCALPSGLPDDLALLVDDVALVIRTSNVVKQRGVEKVAIVTDGVTGCAAGLLARYLSQALGFARDNIHVFATASMGATQQAQLRQNATLTVLGVYHSSAFDDVLSKQLAFDGVIDMCSTEASTEFAVKLVQPMGTLVFVDRGRFEAQLGGEGNSSNMLAMDMNAVVVNELEMVSICDCSAEAAAAVAYLADQAVASENRDALRAFLSAPIALGDALDALRRPESVDVLKAQYLQVDYRARET
ncbi:hypothetical protein Gpo141_00001145 [Globisporangium polare]